MLSADTTNNVGSLQEGKDPLAYSKVLATFSLVSTYKDVLEWIKEDCYSASGIGKQQYHEGTHPVQCFKTNKLACRYS